MAEVCECPGRIQKERYSHSKCECELENRRRGFKLFRYYTHEFPATNARRLTYLCVHRPGDLPACDARTQLLFHGNGTEEAVETETDAGNAASACSGTSNLCHLTSAGRAQPFRSFIIATHVRGKREMFISSTSEVQYVGPIQCTMRPVGLARNDNAIHQPGHPARKH